MSMKLLANAVESIAVRLADYKSGTRARLRSAVRNLHAGILLLFKEKLRRLSPPGSNDVLVRSKMVPKRLKSGELRFVGAGKKTVNIVEIQERFKDLGVSADWDSLRQLSEIRNDIEYYYERVEREVIQEALAKAFNVLDSFIREELAEDPHRHAGKRILGSAARGQGGFR